MRTACGILIACCAVFSPAIAQEQQRQTASAIEEALAELATKLAADPERDELRQSLGRSLREQIAEANRRSSAEWSKIGSRGDWEAFRAEKIKALRESLGTVCPDAAGSQPKLLSDAANWPVTAFKIRNLVYQSRPGLVVTANLYVPDPPRPSMPGILISHSHHKPKHEGELQDMGMTWARAGCYVLVPDHLGHGERRQHPFASAADFPKPFPVSRQDYYFRYDTSLQLYLVGESLMGWMVHDLMTWCRCAAGPAGHRPEADHSARGGGRRRRPGRGDGGPRRADRLRRAVQLRRPAAGNPLSASRRRRDELQLRRQRKLGIDAQPAQLGCGGLSAVGDRRQRRPAQGDPRPRVQLGPRARPGLEAVRENLGLLRRCRSVSPSPTATARFK